MTVKIAGPAPWTMSDFSGYGLQKPHEIPSKRRSCGPGTEFVSFLKNGKTYPVICHAPDGIVCLVDNYSEVEPGHSYLIRIRELVQTTKKRAYRADAEPVET